MTIKETDNLIKERVDSLLGSASLQSSNLRDMLTISLYQFFYRGVKFGRLLEKNELESNRIKELEEMAKYYGH